MGALRFLKIILGGKKKKGKFEAMTVCLIWQKVPFRLVQWVMRGLEKKESKQDAQTAERK